MSIASMPSLCDADSVFQKMYGDRLIDVARVDLAVGALLPAGRGVDDEVICDVSVREGHGCLHEPPSVGGGPNDDGPGGHGGATAPGGNDGAGGPPQFNGAVEECPCVCRPV